MTTPRSRSLRVGKVRIGGLTVLWLAVLWMLLWGDLSFGNAVAGLALGILVTVLLPLPTIGFRGRVRPLGVLRLVGHFIKDLVLASFQVALIALDPTRTPHGAVIGIHLRSESDLYLVLTAVLSTLVPGSLVVEAHRQNGMLYIHVLDVESMGGIEAVRADVLAIEERVLRALAADAEIERAGLAPARIRRGGESR